MGQGMARNLKKQNLLSAVWNRTAAKAEQFAREEGIEAAADLAGIARSCDTIVICVSADNDVLEVVDQLLPHLQPNSLLIECSTISADTARTAAHRVRAKNVSFLDAPVSGGTEGARNASLASAHLAAVARGALRRPGDRDRGSSCRPERRHVSGTFAQ